jgi:hypothetical protein
MATDALHYDPLLPEKAAAEHLGNKPATMRKWRCVGGGPEYVKVGRLVRYPLSSLERYKRNRTRCSTRENRSAGVVA